MKKAFRIFTLLFVLTFSAMGAMDCGSGSDPSNSGSNDDGLPAPGGEGSGNGDNSFATNGFMILAADEPLLPSPIQGFTVDQLMQQKIADGTHIRNTTDGYLHCGADFRFEEIDNDAGLCIPVVAVAPGIVTQAGDPDGRSGSGYTVTIRHPGIKLSDNFPDHELFTHYIHLKADSMTVSNGDRVVTGQQVACVGNTGTNNPTNHLHMEVRPTPKSEIDETDIANRVDYIPNRNYTTLVLPILAYNDTANHRVENISVDQATGIVTAEVIFPGNEPDPFGAKVTVIDNAGAVLCESGFTYLDVLYDENGDQRCEGGAGTILDGEFKIVETNDAEHSFGNPEFNWTYTFNNIDTNCLSNGTELKVTISDIRGNEVSRSQPL